MLMPSIGPDDRPVAIRRPLIRRKPGPRAGPVPVARLHRRSAFAGGAGNTRAKPYGEGEVIRWGGQSLVETTSWRASQGNPIRVSASSVLARLVRHGDATDNTINHAHANSLPSPVLRVEGFSGSHIIESMRG